MKPARFTLPLLALLIFAFAVIVVAQDTAPAPVPAAQPAKPDTSLLKRTPAIDGVIEPGEWDVFLQTQQGEFSGTVYTNWDDAGLYIAAQTNKAADVMITLDGNNDGWFHGADNYLVKATNGPSGAVTVSMEKYDSHAKIDAPGATQTIDASGIIYRHTVKDGACVLEMSLPKASLPDVKVEPSANIGLRVGLRQAVEDARWIPMVALGDVDVCSLTEGKVAAPDQLDVSLVLQDAQVVAGQKLMAKLYIKNKGAQPTPVECFVIGGDGRAARYLNSEKIVVEGMQPGEVIKHRFESKIPEAMPLGSWALGAEVRCGEKTQAGAALASFEVIRPFSFSMSVGEDPLVIGSGKDRTVIVEIANHTPDRVLGDIVITLPGGWGLKPNLTVRKFEVRGENQKTSVRFRVTPPTDARPGEIPIKVDVNVGGKKYSLNRDLRLAVEPE